MLPGKVASAVRERLAGFLVAAELDVLADFPVGVRTEQEGIRQRRIEGRPPVPLAGDSGENRLELVEQGLAIARCVRGGGLTLEGCQRNAATGVVDEDPRQTVLRACYIPGVLVAGVGIGGAVTYPDLWHPRSGSVIPVPRGELELELGVRAVAELGDCCHFETVEIGLAIIQRAQDREGKGKDNAIERGGDGAARSVKGQRIAAAG